MQGHPDQVENKSPYKREDVVYIPTYPFGNAHSSATPNQTLGIGHRHPESADRAADLSCPVSSLGNV